MEIETATTQLDFLSLRKLLVVNWNRMSQLTVMRKEEGYLPHEQELELVERIKLQNMSASMMYPERYLKQLLRKSMRKYHINVNKYYKQ